MHYTYIYVCVCVWAFSSNEPTFESEIQVHLIDSNAVARGGKDRHVANVRCSMDTIELHTLLISHAC